MKDGKPKTIDKLDLGADLRAAAKRIMEKIGNVKMYIPDDLEFDPERWGPPGDHPGPRDSDRREFLDVVVEEFEPTLKTELEAAGYDDAKLKRWQKKWRRLTAVAPWCLRILRDYRVPEPPEERDIILGALAATREAIADGRLSPLSLDKDDLDDVDDDPDLGYYSDARGPAEELRLCGQRYFYRPTDETPNEFRTRVLQSIRRDVDLAVPFLCDRVIAEGRRMGLKRVTVGRENKYDPTDGWRWLARHVLRSQTSYAIAGDTLDYGIDDFRTTVQQTIERRAARIGLTLAPSKRARPAH